jgi:transcriptional regulator with XRE-family HTH domain
MTGRELKHIRERLGWSQARLAEAVGVAPNSIARQERGELGIKESLARLIRLVAEQNEDSRAAHSQAGGRTAPDPPEKRKTARNSRRKNRKGKGSSSVS